MIPAPPDPLERALSHPPHLDDAGFVGRVLAALPRRSHARALILTLGGLASAGAGALFLLGPLVPLLQALAAGRAASPGDVLAALVALATPLATAAVALGAERALRPDPTLSA
jgi:hypothetical protein